MAKSNVDLVIRARNEASKAIGTIADSIRTLTKEQDELSGSAARTDGLLRKLGNELSELEAKTRGLREIGKASAQLEKLNAKIAAQENTVAKAAERYDELKAKLEATEKPTKRLQAQVEKAGDSYEKQTDKLSGLRQEFDQLNAELAQAKAPFQGVIDSENDLAVASSKAAAEVQRVRTRLETLKSVKGPKAVDLSEGLNIPDVQEVSRAIDTMVESTQRVSQASNRTEEDVRELASSLDTLKRAGDSLREMDTLIGTLRDQQRAAKEAKRDWRQLEDSLKSLRAEYANTAEPSAELARSLGLTEGLARQAKRTYEAQRDVAGQLASALRKAGVSTADLAGEQARIRAEIDRTTAAYESTKAALPNWQQEAAQTARYAQEQQKLKGVQQELQRASLETARQLKAAGATANDAWREATQDVTMLAQAMRKVENPTAAMQRSFEQAKARAADLKQEARSLEGAFAKLQRQLRKSVKETDASVKGNAELADVLKQSEAALKSMDKAQSQIGEGQRQTAAAIQAAEKAYKDQAAAAAEAAAAERKLQSDIEETRATLKELEAASEQLATAYDKAKQEAAQLRDAIASQTKPSEQARAALAAADQTVAELGKQNKTLETAIRQTNRALQQMESGQSGAAASTQRMVSSAREAISAMDRYEREIEQMGDAARRARREVNTLGDAMLLFRDNSRKAMSVTQRLRGQLLSLASAYIGLYGAADAIRNIADTAMRWEAVEVRLGTAFDNNTEKVREEIKWLKQLAAEMSLVSVDLAENYSKLANSSKGTALEGDRLRYVFQAITVAARTNKWSQDELNRVLKATDQVMGKSKVSAEELRQQMGEVFPAAKLMAQGLGISREEMEKMMQDGKLTSDALVAMADAMYDTYSAGMENALDSANAAVQRFQEALNNLQVVIANSGFLDEMVYALEELTAQLSSPEGQEGARKLGAALGDLFRLLGDLVQNIDEVITALKAFAAIWATGKMIQVGFWAYDTFTRISKGLMGLAEYLKTATGLMATFARALTGVGLVLAAFSLAEWAANNFEPWARFWVQVKAVAKVAVMQVINWLKKLTNYIVITFRNLPDLALQPLRKMAGDLAQLGGKAADFLGLDEIRDDLKAFAGQARGSYEEVWNGYTGEISAANERLSKELDGVLKGVVKDSQAQLKEYLANISDGAAQATDEAEKKLREALDKSGLGDRPNIDRTGLNFFGDGDAGEKELDSLRSNVASTLEQIRTDLAEATADTLEERLQLIADRYAKLKQDLLKAGYAQDSAAMQMVDQYIAVLQKRETIRFNEEKINELMEYRRDLQEQITFLQENGGANAGDEIARLKEQLQGVNTELTAAIDKAIAFAQSIGDEQLIAKLQRMRQSVVEVGQGLISAKAINDAFASGATQAFQSLGNTIGMLIDGTYNLKQGFAAALDAFRTFAANFLQQIAQMIFQAMILKALTGDATGGGGGLGGVIEGFVNQFHDGGVVGSGGTARLANPEWFLNAQRYHTGGVAGLKPNEVPAILERGEEVLTANDPRHSANGGAAAQDIQIVNAIDSDSLAQAVFAAPSGKRSLMNMIRANKNEIKTVLG